MRYRLLSETRESSNISYDTDGVLCVPFHRAFLKALYDTLRQRDLVRKVELRALSEAPPGVVERCLKFGRLFGH